MRAGRPNPRQMRGVDALINQPPQRARRGHRPERLLAVTPQCADRIDAVRAVGHRRGQISEHHPGCMHPRPPVGIGQHGCDLRRQPGQIGDLPQHAHPGMRHDTGTVG
ncbi:hypothetical protein MLAC_13900 [Mycobacterium lacus]|uniref:Uncharacterized protein n=1 Tax=Mycobacterium lacus TaxID=169765 RepID=A0A7I7NHH1_9MYCO|nr:hypothetical protein MLAC_13900 [Mycobacterium lacus]